MQILGQVRDLVVQLLHDFALQQGWRRVWLAGAQRSHPFCNSRERLGECPAHEHQGKQADQQGLYQRIQKRIAESVRDLPIDVAGVMNQQQSAGDFIILMKRHSVHMDWNGIAHLRSGGLLRAQKFAHPLVVVNGFRYGVKVQGQGWLEPWRYGKQMACRIVDGNSFAMLALPIPLHETVQASLLAPAQFPLDAFLETVRQALRPAREVVAQDSPLVPHLVSGENERHATDAHDQGQDNFQSRAHLGSSIQEMKMCREGWTRVAMLN